MRVRAALLAMALAVAPALSAPREVTEPEVGEFARRAAMVALSRGGVSEEQWRKGLAEVATAEAVSEIDAAWVLAGYDAAAEERPRYLASPGTRSEVKRLAPGRWTVGFMVAQSYAAKEVSGARGLQVLATVVLADPASGRLAVERIRAE